MSSRKRKLDAELLDQDTPSTSYVKVVGSGLVERECEGHRKALGDGFLRLMSEGKFCDFVIVIEGEKIPVHRAVLAASSKYYEAMVTHDTAERKKGRVEIQDVTLKAGRQCIEFMYTGKVSFSLENPEDLIHAAELMELPALTDLYFEFLKEKFTIKDCLKYLQLAETFSRRPFTEFFKKLSVKNFVDVVDCEELPNLSLALMEECLKAVPASGRQSETAKWTAIITWLNTDIETRQKAFPTLFRTLKLQYFTEDFLREIVLTKSCVKTSSEVKEMILSTLLDQTRPKPGGGAFVQEISYIICCRSESRMLFRFNVKTHQMERYARIPSEVFKKYIDIVSLDGEVYLTSGDAVHKVRNGKLVNLLDTGRNSEYHQCISHGNVIYIVSKDCTSKYNTQTNEWITLPTGPHLGEGFFMTSSGNFLYAMGGESSLKTAREFDLVTETWDPIASMLLERKFGAAVWYDRKIYALGGRTSDQDRRLEFYSTNSDMWSYASSNIKCTNCKCKAFTVGTEVFVVGGVKIVPVSRGGLFCNTSCHASSDSITKLDLKKSESTSLIPFQTDSRLACAVYYN